MTSTPAPDRFLSATVADFAAETRPVLSADAMDLPALRQKVWTVVEHGNDPPHLFRHGGALVRLQSSDDGRPVLADLTADRLRYELASISRWVKRTRHGEQEVVPPSHVIADMLADPDPPLPVLTRIVAAPVFAPDGTLHTTPGYHPAGRTYYAPAPGLRVPAVPPVPTPADVARARSLILDELFGDFPFESDADRAHAVALFLLPFVRDLIDGPTPIHLVEAPTPGSGKGLLIDAALRPALGEPPSVVTQKTDEEEWRRTLTAQLRTAPVAILIDNVTRPLNSGTLAAAITALYWEDRVLGSSATLRLPVRCVWVVSANNPVLSTEIARRALRIRLDARVERPWQRQGFRHTDLIAWGAAHRGELVWAGLVLAQAWIAAQMPPGAERLGSFDRWAEVLGGILTTVGIRGFLTNLDDLYDVADLEQSAWQRFVELWWSVFGTQEVGTAELFVLAQATEGLELEGADERGQRTSFGKLLSQRRGQVIGGFRMTLAGQKQRAKRWRLLPTTEAVNIGTSVNISPLRAAS